MESWDLFVDRAVELALADRTVELCGADVGLRAARELPRGAFSLLEYTMRTAPDLGSALEHLLRYGALLGNPPAIIERYGTGDGIEFQHRAAVERDAECCIAEFALDAVAWMGRAATVEPRSPTRVDFTHPPRFAESSYRAHFRCAMAFCRPATALGVPPDVLDTPMADADPRLHGLLLRYYAEHGFGPYDTRTFAASVRRGAGRPRHRLAPRLRRSDRVPPRDQALDRPHAGRVRPRAAARPRVFRSTRDNRRR